MVCGIYEYIQYVGIDIGSTYIFTHKCSRYKEREKLWMMPPDSTMCNEHLRQYFLPG